MGARGLRGPGRLDRALSRERAKDTTLDYQAGFAERRGLVPQSEIFLRRAPERPDETPRLRQGMFAGLKLGSAKGWEPSRRETSL